MTWPIRSLLLSALAAGAFHGLPARGDRMPLPQQRAGVPWPTENWGEAAPRGVDSDALGQAVDALFEPVGWSGLPDTRALLVVQGGEMVLERHAEGFGPDSRFHSWSMAKSVTQALVGTLVAGGQLSLDAPAPVAAWRGAGDPRGELTLRHLLHMGSGLDNADGFSPDGADPMDLFATRLLFGEGSSDLARYATEVALVHEPGTRWDYSTGTSTIVGKIVGDAVGAGPDDTVAYARRALMEPLGIRSLVLEFDAAGTYLGGSDVYATARDWARLGLLYLRDGVWDGRRILPEGWVDFTRTPAPASNNGSYGAHFWLNEPAGEGQFPEMGEPAPRSAFEMNGNGGQMVIIVPTHDLVLVRLGELQTLDWPGVKALVAELIALFPAVGGAP